MPLTDEQKHLLYEIYDVTYAPDTIVADQGIAVSPIPYWSQTSLKDALDLAVQAIDADETKVSRVATILGNYSDLNLDPSNIDRNGYSFRYNKSVQTLRRALYTYTGIWSDGSSGSNALVLG